MHSTDCHRPLFVRSVPIKKNTILLSYLKNKKLSWYVTIKTHHTNNKINTSEYSIHWQNYRHSSLCGCYWVGDRGETQSEVGQYPAGMIIFLNLRLIKKNTGLLIASNLLGSLSTTSQSKLQLPQKTLECT